jgi:bifunctional DNA-binding transcriptional regulator/antitoxin component of YhaV-PrlF toxin-antitoxin module
MLLQADARRRITIPPNLGVKPGDTLELEMLPDGRLVLVPVEPIPKHQLWAWEPEARRAVETSLKDERPSIVVETPEGADDVAADWEREG